MDQYVAMLTDLGFQVMNPRIDQLGYDEDILKTDGEAHPIIVAKK